MNKPNRHTYLAVLALLVLGQVGCASVPRLPQEVQSQLGVIGVVSLEYAPSAMPPLTPPSMPPLVYDKPAKGSGAWGAVQGTGQGALVALLIAVQSGGYGIVLAPFVMVAGAYHRASTALPAEVVEQAEVALKNAFAESKIQQAMSEHLIGLIRTRSETRVVRVTDPGPCTSWMAKWRVGCRAPAYKDLGREGIDTVLEIGPVRVGLGPTGLGNPNLRLSTSAFVRLIRVKTPTESFPQPPTADRRDPHGVRESTELLFSHVFSHKGEPRLPFTKWAENDAELFRRELTRSIEALGGQIADALFCSNSSSPCNEAIREEADQSLEKEAGQTAGRSGDVEDQPAPGEGTDERSNE